GKCSDQAERRALLDWGRARSGQTMQLACARVDSRYVNRGRSHKSAWRCRMQMDRRERVGLHEAGALCTSPSSWFDFSRLQSDTASRLWTGQCLPAPYAEVLKGESSKQKR